MAKKDTDNFDFEVEGEGKAKAGLNLDFIKNLTKQQKGIILGALIAIVLVVAMVVICVVVGATGGNNGSTNGGGNNGGSETGGENDGGNDVVSGVITDFYISSLPDKKIYYVGEVYDYTGLSIFINSTEGYSQTVYYEDSPMDFKITGFDTSKAVEEQIITVEYAGQTDTFTIEIKEKPTVTASLVSIRLDPDNMPASTCKLGYAPDIDGAKLICEYSDGSTKTINLAYVHLYDYMTDMEDVPVGGVATIRVIYDEKGVAKQTSFDVTIVE